MSTPLAAPGSPGRAAALAAPDGPDGSAAPPDGPGSATPGHPYDGVGGTGRGEAAEAEGAGRDEAAGTEEDGAATACLFAGGCAWSAGQGISCMGQAIK